MNDPLGTQNSDDSLETRAASKPSQWLEFGPIGVFVLVFNVLNFRGHESAMLIAAAIFMVLAVAALIYVKTKYNTAPPMLLLTTAIIVVTVMATLLTGDKRFFYMKPTVVNLLFGVGVMGGVIFKKNVLKLLMGEAYSMPEKAWNIFAIRWGLFFFAMAAINEYIWRTTIDPNVPSTESFWANFKLFGFMPLTILFVLSQIPFLLKHSDLKEKMDNNG